MMSAVAPSSITVTVQFIPVFSPSAFPPGREAHGNPKSTLPRTNTKK